MKNHYKKGRFNFKSKFWARDKEAVALLIILAAFAAIFTINLI